MKPVVLYMEDDGSIWTGAEARADIENGLQYVGMVQQDCRKFIKDAGTDLSMLRKLKREGFTAADIVELREGGLI